MALIGALQPALVTLLAFLIIKKTLFKGIVVLDLAMGRFNVWWWPRLELD